MQEASAGPASALQAKSLHEALRDIARDIKTKRHAQGLADSVQPRKALGSVKTVAFKLPLKNGQGQDSDREYCFGYTLKCRATVTEPVNTFSGTVSSSEGSQVKLQDLKTGQPLTMTMQTQFFGDTTFRVHLQAQDRPYPPEVKVELTCSY